MSYFSVNDNGGNSIFDIAYRFKQMELREMEKVPTTIRENKLNGSDTGSSDFLTKLQELHSMIFHIDKKSDVPIAELNTIDRAVQSLNRSFLVQSDVNKYFKEFIKEGGETGVAKYLKRSDKYEVKSAGAINDKFDELLKDAGTEDNKVWSLLTAFKDVVDTVKPDIFNSTNKVKDTNAFKKAKGIHDSFIINRLSELGDAMSQDTFEKLSKVNDSIPNLLKTILKMVNELVSQSNGKSEVWGGEYDDKNKRKLDETIKEIETEFNSLENRPSINQYIRIYKQIEEPLSILITNVKGMIDNTVTFRGPQQFSLRPLEVISEDQFDEIMTKIYNDIKVDFNDIDSLNYVLDKMKFELYHYIDNSVEIIDGTLENMAEEILTLLVNYPNISDKYNIIYRDILNFRDIIAERTANPEEEHLSRVKAYNINAQGRFNQSVNPFSNVKAYNINAQGRFNQPLNPSPSPAPPPAPPPPSPVPVPPPPARFQRKVITEEIFKDINEKLSKRDYTGRVDEFVNDLDLEFDPYDDLLDKTTGIGLIVELFEGLKVEIQRSIAEARMRLKGDPTEEQKKQMTEARNAIDLIDKKIKKYASRLSMSGKGKRRDAKQYLDPEYYHFINTMPKKRFL